MRVTAKTTAKIRIFEAAEPKAVVRAEAKRTVEQAQVWLRNLSVRTARVNVLTPDDLQVRAR